MLLLQRVQSSEQDTENTTGEVTCQCANVVGVVA